MKPKILGALLRKEIMLLKRNPFIPKIVLIMPIMVMLLAPLFTTMDVRNVKVAVVDNDHSVLSRRIITDMDNNGTLNIEGVFGTYKEALRQVEADCADVILTIPYDFSKTFRAPDIEANGVNAIKGLLGSGYVGRSIANTLQQWSAEQGRDLNTAQISIINMYNPTLEYRNYMIPALMIVLLIVICGFLPTLSIMTEKESGTIEAMNVTPVGRFTFVLSKLIPFWLAGLIVITVGMLVGWLVYGLVPGGSIAAIYLAAVLFILFMSGLGVWVANGSSTMLQSIFVMFAVIIIFQLMSGLFTPISSMPQWAQTITYAIPPRYFNEIMRAVYLKGTSIPELWLPYTGLAAGAALSCTLAALSYKKQS